MNINEAYPTKYLGAADLQGRQVKVTIEDVTRETVGDDIKPVIYFRGKQKSLVLNKTNAMRIADVLGSGETDHWIGKDIWLHTERVDFQGKRTDAVRVMDRPPVTAAAPQQHQAPPMQPTQQSENPAPLPPPLPQHPKNQIARPQMAEMNDEIPF